MLTLAGFSNAFGSNILIIEPLSGQNGKSIKAELEGILLKNGIKGHKVVLTGPYASFSGPKMDPTRVAAQYSHL